MKVDMPWNKETEIECLTTREDCSLPCYIKKKGNTGMRMREYWWVSRSLMTARKMHPCAVSSYVEENSCKW